MNRVGNFSEEKTKRLIEALEHGLGELKTDDEMDMYLATYGEIHQSKLIMAFTNLPRKILAEHRLSVIDYGCGQGIASMVLCDFLQEKVGHPEMISGFHIIEPSKPCLQRAVSNIGSFCPDSHITDYNITCENIWRLDIQPQSEVVLHLFSNVIDIPNFPRTTICNILNKMNNHNNVVVCVSPFYQENGRAKLMDEFANGLSSFSCCHKFEKHTDEWDKPYSCQIRIFVNSWY